MTPPYVSNSGVIEDIDYFGTTSYLGIEAEDGKRYRVPESRIVNAPCGHRCLARVGDEVIFTLSAEGRVIEVRFVKWPECKISDDEVSVVNNIDVGLIFGKRIKPNCGCPILIGRADAYPDIQVGMIVQHNLGRYNNKVTATNVRIDWSQPYKVPTQDAGEENEIELSAGA